MSSTTRVIPAAVLLAVALVTAAPAQQIETQTMTFNRDSVVIIPGLGAIIESAGDTLRATFVPPIEMRPDEFKEVDLREKDLILMADGKRLRTTADLRTLLDAAAVGDTIKLGLKRGDDIMISSLVKGDADPGSGPVVMMRVEAEDQGAARKTVTMGGADGTAETVAVLEGGLIVGPGSDGLQIIALLPDAEERLAGEMPQAGDRLVSINGESRSGPEALQLWYDGLPGGDSITVVFEREGIRHTARYVKAPPGSGRTVIKRQ